MARHSPRCALCGAPTRPQTVGGVQSLVCVACGAATVDQRALEQLVAQHTPPPAPSFANEPRPNTRADDLTLEEPMLHLEGLAALDDQTFESELEHLKAQRRRQLGLLLGMAGVLLAFLVITPLLVLTVGAVFTGARLNLAPPPPPMVVPAPPPLPSEPVPAPEPVPDPSPDPIPEPQPPEPAPVPTPAPADDGFSSLMAAGWKIASRQPADAEKTFRKALAIRPTHPDAHYGLGYSLLKQDRLDEARSPLCTARSSSNAETRRDVDALLANSGLTCSP